MFEVGALSKNLDKSRVCPILFGFDPTDIKGPLEQFQTARFEEQDIKKVVKMINRELGDSALAPGVLDDVFAMWWPKLKQKVDAILANVDHAQSAMIRSDRDIPEEVLTLTRSPTRKTHPTVSPFSPAALRDLLRSYRRLIERARDLPHPDPILVVLHELARPLEHLISKMDSGSDRNSLLTRYYDCLSRLEEASKEPVEDEATEKADDDLPF